MCITFSAALTPCPVFLKAKNVAAEIAVQLCESVAKKLEGKVMGTFTSKCPCGILRVVWSSGVFPVCDISRFHPLFPAVTSTVKQALQEALVQILQPQRRVDVLRDVMDAQRNRRPYVVTFCGVNGVGKSTNLAKVGRDPGSQDWGGEIRLCSCFSDLLLLCADLILAH